MELLTPSDLGPLIEEYQERVYRCAVRMVRSVEDAEDITQTTWQRFCKRVSDGGVHRDNVFAYLIRILRNEAIRFAGQRNEHASGDLEVVDRAPGIDASITRLLIEDCLPRLEPVAQRILQARFFEGLTFKEICERDNVPYTTAHRVAQNGLNRLRAMLDAADIELGDFR